MSSHFDPAELPSVKKWAEVHEGTVWDFLGSQCSAEQALAFSSLFWPAFVEIRGCILLQERYEPSNFDEWWRELGGQTREIEKVINHIHLWDFFYSDEQGIPASAFQQLAEVLSSTWACALRGQFPDRVCEVWVTQDDEGDYGPTISLATAPIDRDGP